MKDKPEQRLSDNVKLILTCLIVIDAVMLVLFLLFKLWVGTTNIKSVQSVEGTNKSSGPHGVRIDYHYIKLICYDNKEINMKTPKNYTGLECVNCKIIIEKIMKDNNIDISQIKEYEIFKDYKKFIIFFILFNIKAAKHRVKGNPGINNIFRVCIGIFLLLMVDLFIGDATYDYQKVVRSDYINYLQEDYRTYTGKLEVCDGVDIKEVSWVSLDKQDHKYLYSKEKDMIFVTDNEKIDEKKVYKVKYLPNTHLIVEMKEK